jgi:hypothetical protein
MDISVYDKCMEDDDYYVIRMAFAFGFLIYGNILDNIHNPKKFGIVLEFFLAFSYILVIIFS